LFLLHHAQIADAIRSYKVRYSCVLY